MNLVRALQLAVVATAMAGAWDLRRLIRGSEVQIPDEIAAPARPRPAPLRPSGRRIFGPARIEVPRPATPPAAPPPALPPPPSLSELASPYALIGVLNDGRPQAILQDRRSQRTFYVTAGQSLGEIEVRLIDERGVTLGLGAETLRLAF